MIVAQVTGHLADVFVKASIRELHSADVSREKREQEGLAEALRDLRPTGILREKKWSPTMIVVLKSSRLSCKIYELLSKGYMLAPQVESWKKESRLGMGRCGFEWKNHGGYGIYRDI